MFSWSISATGTAKASPSDVWKIWKDVPNWPTWDTDLEWSRLDGDFAEGTTGTLKPKGWFSSKFTITKIESNKKHSDTTYMPFTTLVFEHRVESINKQQVKIMHDLKVSGLLAPLLWLTMRFQLKKSVPHALKNLVQKVEKNQ